MDGDAMHFVRDNLGLPGGLPRLQHMLWLL